MSGDDNDENGVNELMNIACDLTLRFTFSFVSFMLLISGRASLDLSCDFIIRLLHNTQSLKSKFFLQLRCIAICVTSKCVRITNALFFQF